MQRLFLIAAACGLVLSGLLSETRAADSVTLAVEVKEILRANCSECHSGAGATAGIRVLDHSSLVDNGLIDAGRPDASRLFEVITSTDGDAMPPESRPPLSGEQIATIRNWIAAGAAPFPVDISSPSDWVAPGSAEADASATTAAIEEDKTDAPDDRGVLAIILAHVRTLSADDRPFYRYFSTRHRLRSGATRESLAVRRLALAKAVNHLSLEPELVIPTPLDDLAGGTVFAVDIRRLGWHRRIIRPVDPEPAGTVADQQSLTRFDLLLLEYPYSVFRDDDPTTLAVADEFLRHARQVRPIPFLRVDWFCSVALQPPLYHDLMALPQSLKELEKQLGVDTRANLDDALARRAGVTVSGVSRNNRIVERHPQSNGYYWKSHDFASNAGSENILVNPIDFSPSGGEMIFRLPNGTQGYFVCSSRGERIDAAPTSIVIDKHASDRVVRNGLGCIRCHSAGIKPFHDDVRAVLEVLPARPGFDKTVARRMYPGNEEWARQIERDQARFRNAMAEIGVEARGREPLTVVTTEYLEQTITAQLAAAELGLSDKRTTGGKILRTAAEQLAAVCSSPNLTRLGLASFAAGGVIRRDSWEDNFDTATRDLGVGVPIVPVNGLLRGEYLNSPIATKIKLRTNKRNGLFEVGDQLRIFVDNNSGGAVFVDLFGTGSQGKTVRLGEAGVEIAAGATLQFPAKGDDPIEITSGVGREQITLYVSDSPLPASTVFRGKNAADRVVHQSYVLEHGASGSAAPRIESDAARIIKKSLFIETK